MNPPLVPAISGGWLWFLFIGWKSVAVVTTFGWWSVAVATTFGWQSVAVETKLGWRSVPVVTKIGWKSDHKKSQNCNFKKFGTFLEFVINVLLISMANFIGGVIFVSSATLILSNKKYPKCIFGAFTHIAHFWPENKTVRSGWDLF